MLCDKLTRCASLESILLTSEGKELQWSQWANCSFLDYLNIIDCVNRKKTAIPWLFVSHNQENVLQFCKRSVYTRYKTFMFKLITNCDPVDLPLLIRKILCVTKVLNITHDYDEASDLYSYLTHSLFNKGCEDPSLLLSMWRVLCVLDRTKVAIFSRIIGKERHPKLLRYQLEVAQKVHFNFWGAWTNEESYRVKYCPVTTALLGGNLEQLKLLLQYGFKPTSERLHSYDKFFHLRFNCYYEWLRKPLVEEVSNRRKIITEVLLFLANLGCLRSEAKIRNMANCFYHLWSVLPTPIVTVQELENEVLNRFSDSPYCFQPSQYPTSEKQFMTLINFYETLFYYENASFLQPRSLQQLCKCAIRTQLQKSWNLPLGVKALPLPNKIISFLQVETDLLIKGN